MYSNICSYRKFIFVTPWFLLFSVSLIVTTWYGLSENLLWYCTHTVASSRKALIGELLDYPLTTQVVLLGLKFEELSWDYAKPSQENNEDCLPCLFIQFCVIENGRRVSKILQVTSWLSSWPTLLFSLRGLISFSQRLFSWKIFVCSLNFSGVLAAGCADGCSHLSLCRWDQTGLFLCVGPDKLSQQYCHLDGINCWTLFQRAAMYAEDGDGNIYNDNSSTEADGETKVSKTSKYLPHHQIAWCPWQQYREGGFPRAAWAINWAGSPIDCFLKQSAPCLRLTLATFDDEGHCIGHMGSWSFSSWRFNRHPNPNPTPTFV